MDNDSYSTGPTPKAVTATEVIVIENDSNNKSATQRKQGDIGGERLFVSRNNKENSLVKFIP